MSLMSCSLKLSCAINSILWGSWSKKKFYVSLKGVVKKIYNNLDIKQCVSKIYLVRRRQQKNTIILMVCRKEYNT